MFTIDFIGIKSYSNFLYYTAIQDESGFDYNSMGYPFKENILFADCTPLLALLRGKSILLAVQNPIQFLTAKEPPASKVTESF